MTETVKVEWYLMPDCIAMQKQATAGQFIWVVYPDTV